MEREVRPAAVAGAFYAADAPALRRQIAWCFEHPLGPGAPDSPALPVTASSTTPRAVISPHAGYRYSGPVAAHAYRALWEGRLPELVVIVGPNHHMLGAPLAIPAARLWWTPLGLSTIDRDAAVALGNACSALAVDDGAHSLEHSVEVQVPFLQYTLGDNCRLLPIVMYEQDLAPCRELGQAIANVLRGRSAVIVASSDFTHYETHASTVRRDRWALRAIEELDAEGLARAIERHRVTMCGAGPVVVAITAGRALGATRGRTLRYATSGEVSGDYSQVVGYAALAIE